MLSRFPIVDQKRHGLAQPARNGRIFNRFYLHRCIQQVALDLGRGRTLSLLNVHLEAFDMANRRSQARAMARLMRRIGDHGLALGDLNTVAPEAELRHAFEDEPETDFRGDDTMATLRQTGWNEVGDQALTFPANKPNRRLDHIFSSPDLRTEGGGLMDEGGEPSSDHCPLLFEVQL